MKKARNQPESYKPTPADARAAHLHYDAATRAMKHLKKYADAFALVRGSVPDRKLSKQLAVCAENQILQY
jgi:hypothetical protein